MTIAPSRSPRRAWLRRVLPVALLALLSAAPAAAQEWPARPIRLIVAWPPGGGADLVARMVAQQLTVALGQPVVVENRPGAAGTIGSEIGVRAAPDGHTLLAVNLGTMAINPALYANHPFDTVRDVQPIGGMVTNPFVIFVSAELPVRDLASYVAHARTRPGVLHFGSSGNGGVTHIAAEMFARAAGVQLVHVPYRGSGPAMNDLAGGRTQMQIDLWAVGEPVVQAGRVRALALTATARSPLTPDLPTTAEAGLPQYTISSWQGVVAPVGTPMPIVERLNREIRAAVLNPEVAARLRATGNEPAPSTPAEFGALIASERERMTAIIREASIKID